MKNKIYGLLGLCSKAGKLVAGTDVTIENIEKQKARLVIIASNSSEKTKKNLEYACDQYDIKLIVFGTIEEISKSIGKPNKAVICVKNRNFADAIMNLYNGGENIE